MYPIIFKKPIHNMYWYTIITKCCIVLVKLFPIVRFFFYVSVMVCCGVQAEEETRERRLEAKTGDPPTRLDQEGW